MPLAAVIAVAVVWYADRTINLCFQGLVVDFQFFFAAVVCVEQLDV